MRYSKDSLETLKRKIDLIELLGSHIELKRAGSAYKALCPFHDEKSPSFMIQRGDSHYHCFGCGAHGDAIQFLISHLGLSFQEAVESLAERFSVPLEVIASDEPGVDKRGMHDALEEVKKLYHAWLLHADEAKPALEYLLSRGISLKFIQAFEIGLAPKNPHFLEKALKGKPFSESLLEMAGLISKSERGSRDFFVDRITFPIHSSIGRMIGFSARKYHEATHGGKYINTKETPLFKKSNVLFGMHLCRKRIMKEKRVIIVEGQIDALQLIHKGLDLTVASLGTAFGEAHVSELLKLGVNLVYLCFDNDTAGFEAMRKCGNLFQKKGVEVRVVLLPTGQDPDTYLKELGVQSFIQKLKEAHDYLQTVTQELKKRTDLTSPAAVNALVLELSEMVRSWETEVMVHQSLKKLASLLDVPEQLLGVGQQILTPFSYRRKEPVGSIIVNPDAILESDFLHWLLKGDPELIAMAKNNVVPEMIKTPFLQGIYRTIYETGQAPELLLLGAHINDAESEKMLTGLLSKRVNIIRLNEQFKETIKKILDRDWLERRDLIRQKIQSGGLTDDEAIALAKEFDALKAPSAL